MNSSNHEKADDSSTVFDADTVTPDEVPSLPAMPPLTASATFTDYLYNNINESASSTSIQEESPANTISELLRRINSRHPAMLSTITTRATATAEEISTNQSSSSSSSKKRTITNSSSHSKRPRRSSRLKRQQPQEQSCVDKSDSEVEGESELEDYEPHEEISTNQSSSFSSQISTKLQRQNELRWENKFEELRAYKRSNGNVNVPQSNKQLGRWVNTQRTEYRNFKANKRSCMTDDRIAMLESIGFEWASPNKGGVTKDESKWNNRFNELREYKELHGDTNVPSNFKDNKQLGKWVSTQRTEYRKFKMNGKSQITSERIELLESIDFEWVCQNYESQWNKRFNELVEYKEKYKDTNVPQRWEDNKELGLWVNKQRREYKKFLANKKAGITKERIQTLELIGFDWVAPNKCSKKIRSLVSG